MDGAELGRLLESVAAFEKGAGGGSAGSAGNTLQFFRARSGLTREKLEALSAALGGGVKALLQRARGGSTEGGRGVAGAPARRKGGGGGGGGGEDEEEESQEDAIAREAEEMEGLD